MLVWSMFSVDISLQFNMEHQNLALNRPLIRSESLTFSALADTYMARYKALDPFLSNRLHFFVEILGS